MSTATVQTYYATPSDLRRMLGGLDVYSDQELARYIQMAEGQVDRLTDTCWAGKPCQTEGYEYHTLTKWRGGIIWGAGIPVFLRHAPVRRFIAIEVFDGSRWYDFVKYGVEARGWGDWWAEYEDGVLYLNLFWFYQGGSELRVKYEYGHDTLPPEIHELTLLYAARYMLVLDARREVIVQGGGFTSARDMLDFLNTRLRELEEQLRASKIIAGTYP